MAAAEKDGWVGQYLHLELHFAIGKEHQQKYRNQKHPQITTMILVPIE
jgi:hypothetical protein